MESSLIFLQYTKFQKQNIFCLKSMSFVQNPNTLFKAIDTDQLHLNYSH